MTENTYLPRYTIDNNLHTITLDGYTLAIEGPEDAFKQPHTLPLLAAIMQERVDESQDGMTYLKNLTRGLGPEKPFSVLLTTQDQIHQDQGKGVKAYYLPQTNRMVLPYDALSLAAYNIDTIEHEWRHYEDDMSNAEINIASISDSSTHWAYQEYEENCSSFPFLKEYQSLKRKWLKEEADLNPDEQKRLAELEEALHNHGLQNPYSCYTRYEYYANLEGHDNKTELLEIYSLLCHDNTIPKDDRLLLAYQALNQASPENSETVLGLLYVVLQNLDRLEELINNGTYLEIFYQKLQKNFQTQISKIEAEGLIAHQDNILWKWAQVDTGEDSYDNNTASFLITLDWQAVKNKSVRQYLRFELYVFLANSICELSKYRYNPSEWSLAVSTHKQLTDTYIHSIEIEAEPITEFQISHMAQLASQHLDQKDPILFECGIKLIDLFLTETYPDNPSLFLERAHLAKLTNQDSRDRFLFTEFTSILEDPKFGNTTKQGITYCLVSLNCQSLVKNFFIKSDYWRVDNQEERRALLKIMPYAIVAELANKYPGWVPADSEEEARRMVAFFSKK